MAHNLQSQLILAINNATAYGESKRSATGGVSGADAGYKIYSVSYHGDLCEEAKSISRLIKTNFPEIRQARQITGNHLQAYLNSKTETCGQETIQKIYSYILKIEKTCEHQYGKCKWGAEKIAVPIVEGDKIKSTVASDGDYSKIVETMKQANSNVYKSVILSKLTGLRVSETAKITVSQISLTGGKFGFGQIVIRGKLDGAKGGRPRIVDILSREDNKTLREITAGLPKTATIVADKNGNPLKSDSISRAFSKAVKKSVSPAEREKWKFNGNHAFRKLFAQNCYDIIRHSGGTKEDAFNYANRQLGHGRDRLELNRAYIANQW